MKITHEILHTIKNEKVRGQSLQKLRSSSFFIFEDTKVAQAAQVFEAHPQIEALGVVTRGHTAWGLLSRSQLFALLGKPFGREILAKREVKDLAFQGKSFDQHQNVYLAAPEIQKDPAPDSWYLLVDSSGHFRGLFSYLDFLKYLSQITQDDIQLAGNLQNRMVPRRQEWKGRHWQGQALSRSALGLGGDLYYHQSLGKGRHFFCIGDVSGKGVAAGYITSLVWGILSSFDLRRGLDKLLEHLNQALIETFHLEKFLTGLFLILDEDRGYLKLADMGHGHYGLARKSKIHRFKLPKTNLPLGIEKEIHPHFYKIPLGSGDRFFAFTDGFVEQENTLGEEWGYRGLLHVLGALGTHWKKAPEKVLTHLDAWRGPRPQQDDATWLQLVMD